MPFQILEYLRIIPDYKFTKKSIEKKKFIGLFLVFTVVGVHSVTDEIL